MFIAFTALLVLGGSFQAGAVSASLHVQEETAAAEAASPAQQGTDVRLFNEYISIIVNATEENTGRFAVETTGGDPDRTSDDNSPLIYKVPGVSPWTSYTTIRIDGVDYVFGGRPTERAGRAGRFGERLAGPRVVDDNRIETLYKIGPLEVLQTLSIIRSSTTGLLDTVRIAYELVNTESKTVNVGVRVMLDTMLGQNDGAPFRVGELAITSDTVFEGDQIPEFWQAFDSLADPRVTAQGSLAGRDVTRPDRVYFTNWGAVADGLWDFNFEPGRDFTRLGEFELDSATAMYWDPRPLQPGERLEYVIHYGLGGISISPGQLSVGVTSPATVTAEPDRVVTFPVVAYIQNTGEGEAREVVARIALPAGLKLAEGEAAVRRLGTLPPGRTAQVSWNVALDRAVGGELAYTVRVEAINAEPNEVSRRIGIVAPAHLDIELGESSGRLRVENGRWEPVPYRVTARVRNSGGADADHVVVRWEAPVGLALAEGDVAAKPLGRLAPGEEVSVSWHIRPQEISAGQPFYSVKGAVSGQRDEYRADGFVDVPPLPSAIYIDTTEVGQVKVGDFFTVRVAAQNVRSFYGAEIVIEYDPRRLELVGGALGVDRGRLFVDASADGQPRFLPWNPPIHEVEADGTRARIRISGDRGEAGAVSLLSTSDTLATLRFRALAAGEHEVRFAEGGVRVYDRARQSVNVQQAVSGKLRVAAR